MNPYDSSEWLALVSEMRSLPADDLPRLVACDWLDERGLTERADFIRLQLEYSRLLEPNARYTNWDARHEANRILENLTGEKQPPCRCFKCIVGEIRETLGSWDETATGISVARGLPRRLEDIHQTIDGDWTDAGIVVQRGFAKTIVLPTPFMFTADEGFRQFFRQLIRSHPVTRVRFRWANTYHADTVRELTAWTGQEQKVYHMPAPEVINVLKMDDTLQQINTDGSYTVKGV